jgi:hypothetical protein
MNTSETMTTSSLETLKAMVAGEVFVPGDGGFEAAYLGDGGAGAELLGPLRELGPERDTFAPARPAALAHLNMDPERPMAVAGDGALLSDLPAGALDALVALAGPEVDTPLQSIELRHLGGALLSSSTGVLSVPLGSPGWKPGFDEKRTRTRDCSPSWYRPC